MPRADGLPEDTLVRRRGEPGANFGIVDTRDGAWIGDSHGPVYYEEWFTAEVAAGMFATQMGFSRTRFRAKPVEQIKLKHAGNYGEFKCDAEEALRKIEAGEVI